MGVVCEFNCSPFVKGLVKKGVPATIQRERLSIIILTTCINFSIISTMENNNLIGNGINYYLY